MPDGYLRYSSRVLNILIGTAYPHGTAGFKEKQQLEILW